MDGHALSRTESRIAELEFELRRLKLETDQLRDQVRYDLRNTNSSVSFLQSGYIVQLVFVVGCGAMGLGLGSVAGKLLKLLFAA